LEYIIHKEPQETQSLSFIRLLFRLFDDIYEITNYDTALKQTNTWETCRVFILIW